MSWTPVFADVTGDITLQLGLFPLGNQTEAVEFAVDFEILSNIDLTISGLSIQNRFALGVTGLEHYILSIRTKLGALDLLTEAVFATPFSNQIPADIDNDGIPNTSDTDIDGDGLDNLIDPTPFGGFQGFIRQDIDGDGTPNLLDPDIDGDGVPNGIDSTPFGTNFVVSPLTRPIGSTVFVKKRVTTTLNIAGVTFTNLGIFEDVNFQHPFPGSMATYGVEDQDFRFGDIMTLSGQTVSGINLRSVTGLGADPNVPNIIKKASFSGSICREPAHFAFCVEQLFIDNVPLGNLLLSSRSEFRVLPLTMDQTFTTRLSDFLGFLDLSASFKTDNALELSPLSASVFVNATPVSVIFNLNTLFELSSVLARAQISLDNASFTTSLMLLPGTGLNSLGLSVRITNLSGLSFFANTTLSSPGTGPGGGFGSHATTFTVSGQIVPALGINSSMTFTQDGLGTANARITFKF